MLVIFGRSCCTVNSLDRQQTLLLPSVAARWGGFHGLTLSLWMTEALVQFTLVNMLNCSDSVCMIASCKESLTM